MEQKTLVMKYGGTSVGSPDAMRSAIAIVKETLIEWPRTVVVTSALAGVTNILLNSAAKAAQGDVQVYQQAVGDLRSRHHDIAAALVTDLARQAQLKQEINYLISEFSNLCDAVSVLGEATPRALDAISGLGERLSARLLAAGLASEGVLAQAVESTQLIITDRDFQSAHPDFDATNQRTRQVLDPLLEKGVVPVVTGFIAATADGVTTTLGRGGSDYSAAILAAALSATEVWIWTDVDGVMTADPRLVPSARTIPEISYREVAELAYYGAKVLHPKTIRPVIESHIGLRVCNTFNPHHPGTRLVAAVKKARHPESPFKNGIKAVTVIRSLHMITIEGRGMLGVPGVAARAFGAVAKTGTSVPLISQASSEQSICFAVPSDSTEDVIEALKKAFQAELASRDIDSIWPSEEVVIVTVVAEGMRDTPGIAGRVFSALGDDRVNILAIAQGSSEVSISLIVDAKDTERAVRALHKLIVEE